MRARRRAARIPSAERRVEPGTHAAARGCEHPTESAREAPPPSLRGALATKQSGGRVMWPLIGVGKAFASPPSEPCWRFSRTRLSSCWFPHRGRLARYRTVDNVNSKKLRERSDRLL